MTMASRLYRASDSAVRAVTRALETAHQGFWLGVASRRALREITARQYRDWDKYTSLEYNRSGLLSWEAEVVERFFSGCATVLVGAVGGGREAFAMAERGFRVTAFDCVPELVEACRRLFEREGIEVAVLSGEPDTVPSDVGTHDGAIVGWGGYMHIPGREARVRFLSQFRAQLTDGGPLLVSFFARREGARSFRAKAAIARFIRRARLSTEPVEVGDSLDRTFDHWFSAGEIRSELEDAGFDAVLVSDQPYGHAVGIARGS